MALKWAGWSANKAVVYFSDPKTWSPQNCPESEESIAYSDEVWTYSNQGKQKVSRFFFNFFFIK